jgi:hypothetical protein
VNVDDLRRPRVGNQEYYNWFEQLSLSLKIFYDEAGFYHDLADGSPAIVLEDGSCFHYDHGRIHNENGPAVILADGERRYYVNGRLHRVNGPAIVRPDGTEIYYENGEKHRDEGDEPAVKLPDGTRQWYKKGQLSRGDRRVNWQPTEEIWIDM